MLNEVKWENVFNKLFLWFRKFELVNKWKKLSNFLQVVFRNSWSFSWLIVSFWQWVQWVDMELWLCLECRILSKWQQCKFLFNIWQESLSKDFNNITWLAQLDTIQWIILLYGSQPITIRTISLINISSSVDELNSNIRILDLLLNKSLNWESLSFKWFLCKL